MKNVIVGGVLAGLAFYIWSTLWYGFIPLQFSELKTMPNEVEIATMLKNSGLEDGMYTYPGMENGGMGDPEHMKKAEAGPIINLMIYRNGGMSGMDTMSMIMFLVYCLIVGILAAYMVKTAGKSLNSFGKRTIMVTLIGVIVWLMGPMTNSIFWGFPVSFSFLEVFAHVIGWLFAGLVIAWRVKPE
ncbi:hypothetical protein K8I28_00260 [bacterium]|nr:hypothetical protein [bacterium]